MPPPPIPFVQGSTASVCEEKGMLVIRPKGGHAFRSPTGTVALYLPCAGLAAVSVRRIDGGAWAALDFTGDFDDVGRPSRVSLSPVGCAEAENFGHAIAMRYRLPKAPREVAAPELTVLRDAVLVSVVGAYWKGHSEAPNFEGIMLRVDDDITLVNGCRYRVVGFLRPASRSSPDEPRPVGYSGARLRALSVDALPLARSGTS
jgi:hypothetical protein